MRIHAEQCEDVWEREKGVCTDDSSHLGKGTRLLDSSQEQMIDMWSQQES